MDARGQTSDSTMVPVHRRRIHAVHTRQETLTVVVTRWTVGVVDPRIAEYARSRHFLDEPAPFPQPLAARPV